MAGSWTGVQNYFMQKMTAVFLESVSQGDMVVSNRTFQGNTPKQYSPGTQRCYSPDETWIRIQPLLPKFGITRVADVTGLDRIGIPVCVAVRPLSRSVAVSAGKGANLVSARVSAVMESIEGACAEEIALPLFLGTQETVGRARAAVDASHLPTLLNADHVDAKMLWIEGKDIATSDTILVPYEAVHTHYTPQFGRSGRVLASTNGLASGNALVEAACHAIYEVIERDALNLWSHNSSGKRNECLTQIPSDEGMFASVLLNQLTSADFDVLIWDITSDISVPVFHCLISDRQDSFGHPGTGTGCHINTDIAISRAILEAVQVRATYISGGRDDLLRREFDLNHLKSFQNAVLEAKQTHCGALRISGLGESTSFEEDVDLLLAQLRKVECNTVAMVDISPPETGIFVVRTIIPGLEGPIASDVKRGRRAKKSMHG